MKIENQDGRRLRMHRIFALWKIDIAPPPNGARAPTWGMRVMQSRANPPEATHSDSGRYAVAMCSSPIRQVYRLYKKAVLPSSRGRGRMQAAVRLFVDIHKRTLKRHRQRERGGDRELKRSKARHNE